MNVLNLTRLNEENKKFVSTMNQRLQSKQLPASIAIAKAVSDRLLIDPTVSREDISSFYDATWKVPVLERLSPLNEYFDIDVPTVEQLCKKFYLIRHHIIVPDTSGLFTTSELFPVLSFFGLMRLLEPALIETINTSHEAIAYVTRGISALLGGLENVA